MEVQRRTLTSKCRQWWVFRGELWGQGSSNDSHYNYTIVDSTYKGDASEPYIGFRKAQIEPLNSKRIE